MGLVAATGAADHGDPGEDEDADGDERRDACWHGHRWEPPRHAQGVPLSSQVDLIDDGVEHAIGELHRAIGQPGHGDPVEVAVGGHARRSVDVAERASASSAARRACVA